MPEHTRQGEPAAEVQGYFVPLFAALALGGVWPRFPGSPGPPAGPLGSQARQLGLGRRAAAAALRLAAQLAGWVRRCA